MNGPVGVNCVQGTGAGLSRGVGQPRLGLCHLGGGYSVVTTGAWQAVGNHIWQGGKTDIREGLWTYKNPHLWITTGRG